jgi:hypothetical protein
MIAGIIGIIASVLIGGTALVRLWREYRRIG